MRYARPVLAFSSLILLAGSLAHARAFPGAARAAGLSTLPAMYGRDFEALWLADSATLMIVAVFFAAVALRPSIASRGVVILVALIPAPTAILISTFVRSFYARHPPP